MLKEALLFGAGLVVGAIGASYALGYKMGQEQRKSTPEEERNKNNEPSPAQA